MSFRGGEVCNKAVTGPGLDEGYFGQEFPTNRHHNQGRSDILLTAGVSFMFVGGGGGGGGDAMELKYFIDLFYGGGSCDTVLWSCRADNRSMTRLRPRLRSEAVCVVCCSALSPQRIIQSSLAPIW